MASEKVTITMSKEEVIAVLSAAEEIFEIYDNDEEYRESDPEWMSALAEGVSTLNSIVYPGS